jgi:hypothetical protein
MIRRFLLAVYLIVGLIVANAHNYFKHLDGAKPEITAVLGVVLWPFVLFGANLHIK